MCTRTRCYLLICILLSALTASGLPQPEDKPDLAIWQQFVAMLRAGPFPPDKVRPYDDSLRAALLGFLSVMREKADWREWERTPEAVRVGQQTTFVLPLTFDGKKKTLSFTFISEAGTWYLQHFESILLRLDKVGEPPVSQFPDVEESQKNWIREENNTSEQVRLFKYLADQKGKDFAFDWFKDGYGYILQAKTWVPLVRERKAFILYMCWEQANLHGNPTRLEKLTDTAAIVSVEPTYLKLYDQTGHLRQSISKADYLKLFQSIWQDRAQKAGWDLRLNCGEVACVFEFATTQHP